MKLQKKPASKASIERWERGYCRFAGIKFKNKMKPARVLKRLSLQFACKYAEERMY